MTLNELSEVARLFTTPVAIGLILVGLFFLFVAAVGVVRLPDVFTRSHAVSLTDSLGALFVLGGLALYEGFSQGFSTNLVKIVIVLVLLYLLNPVIAHATVRAAHRSGLKPWTRP